MNVTASLLKNVVLKINNMTQGWIKLHRKITEHWLYQEKRTFSKFEAWQDLLLHTNHAPNKFIIKGELISLDAGQSARSQVTLATTWNWSRKKVSNFLKLIEKDQMISLKTTKNTSIITIVNWQTYQENDQKKSSQTNTKSTSYKQHGTSKEHQKNIEGTSEEHRKHINKNDKNEKNVNNEKNHHQSLKNDDDDFIKLIDIEKLKKEYPSINVLKELQDVEKKISGRAVSSPENYVRQCLNNIVQKRNISAVKSTEYKHFEGSDYDEVPDGVKIVKFG